MACIINASTSNGLVNSADGSGIVKLQSNGVATNALAWVNFNGTGTVAIRSSYNVSSITDNGTGDYTINFATALSDANYALSGNVADVLGAGTSVQIFSQSTSNVRITTDTYSIGKQDRSIVTVTIHGN